MQTVTTANFNEIIAGGPVLVDFWAPWCGPCVAMEPVLEAYDGIPVAKLNIDDHPDLAQRYDVMSIPTLKVFEGGEVIKSLVGGRSLESLTMELDSFLDR